MHLDWIGNVMLLRLDTCKGLASQPGFEPGSPDLASSVLTTTLPEHVSIARFDVIHIVITKSGVEPPTLALHRERNYGLAKD